MAKNQNFIEGDHFVDVCPEKYGYICQLCGKRYSSPTGLYYHKNNFDHSKIPAKYKPNISTRRGRPRGIKINNMHERLNNSLNAENSSKRKRRAKNHDFRLNNSNFFKPTESTKSKKLTYAESQRLVEIEQNNFFYRVSVDENLPIQKELINDLHCNNFFTPRTEAVKHMALTPKPVFSEKNEYSNISRMTNPIMDMNTFFIPPFPMFKTLSTEVDYEMDEEDVIWLRLVNDQRFSTYNSNEVDYCTVIKITDDDFERVMDTLEKASSFILKTNDGDEPQKIEEDVVCAICLDGECTNVNLIVFCDVCNTAVHQDCYGLPYVPEGQWLCRRCRYAPSKSLSCVLCPMKTGVFKQTSDGGWCHIICALLMPGAKFSNPVFLEPIEVSDISKTRFGVRCRICNRSDGAVIQCTQSHCTVPFHASCAQKAGWLYLERSEIGSNNEEEIAYQVNHRYLPYCAKHFPIYKSPGNPTRNLDILTKNLNTEPEISPPTIHVPVVPENVLSGLYSSLNVWNGQEVVDTIKRYWQLKRYLRCGVPLLRRFSSFSHIFPTFKIEENENSKKSIDGILCRITKIVEIVKRTSVLMQKLEKREKLKIEKSELDELLVMSVVNSGPLFESLIGSLSFNLKTLKNSLDSDLLSKYLKQNFDFTHLKSSDNFKSLIFLTFEKYLLDLGISSKDCSRVKSELKRIMQSWKGF